MKEMVKCAKSKEVLHPPFRVDISSWNSSHLTSPARQCYVVTTSRMDDLMSTVIRISDAAFQRLQTLAEPLVDTPASIIDRVLEYYEQHNSPKPSPKPISKPAAASSSSFDPDSPPDLTHARVLAAVVGEKTASSWKGVVQKVHLVAMVKLKSIDVLQKVTTSNLIPGRKRDKGYEYVKALDASIQKTDANVAWRQSLHLAKEAGVPIKVEFQWLEKQGASRPGQRGVLSWQPLV